MKTLMFVQVWNKNGDSSGAAVQHISSIEYYSNLDTGGPRKLNSCLIMTNGDRFYAEERPAQLMERIETSAFGRD